MKEGGQKYRDTHRGGGGRGREGGGGSFSSANNPQGSVAEKARGKSVLHRTG